MKLENCLKLYIAEKPSLGRAIAAALPKPHKKYQGYIECGNGDVVTWCIGHILEQAEPESYDVKYKSWQAEDLPIIPQQWQLKPKAKTKSQLSVLRKLVKKASQLIHAGDPDREGQLLVDEVIDYLNVSKTKKDQVKRLLISDLNLAAVQRSLKALKSNQEYMPLSISALARSRADWLYGINLTRAYTIQGQKTGFQGVLSVGRVQTPVLGLVVERDRLISEFTPHDYFEVLAHVKAKSNEVFLAKWQPSDACQPHMDEDGRIINKALAENVVRRISGQPATVTKLDEQEKKQSAPLPYNLSALQIDAAKQFSMNAKLVLDVCQALYEKHQLITYPRSDCRYLPEDHHKGSKAILDVLARSKEKYAEFAREANSQIKNKAWNNSKVNAHHAIIPTLKDADKVNLNGFEKSVYYLIVRQYLAQFYPAYRYQKTSVELNIANGKFTASANVPVQLGWKKMFVSPKKQTEDSQDEDKRQEQQWLPTLTQGEILDCLQGEVVTKITQAPKPFTDATLLSAMTNISRWVKDPKVVRVLKETDGLGTEATRAGIIELLFKRGYLQRLGKHIIATEIGKALVNALPKMATTSDMTAQWEVSLNAISERKVNYQNFITPLTTTLYFMVDQAQQQSFAKLPKGVFQSKRKTLRKKRAKFKKAS